MEFGSDYVLARDDDDDDGDDVLRSELCNDAGDIPSTRPEPTTQASQRFIASECAVPPPAPAAFSAALHCAERESFASSRFATPMTLFGASAGPTRCHDTLSGAGAHRSTALSSTHSRRPKADTNVVCIRFSELVSPANMHTGDPVRCTNCSAVLSSLSRLAASPGKEHPCWRCDFCEHDNEVDMHPQEQPRMNDVTYMISPPPQMSAAADSTEHSDSIIVFCIDISGSMSVTTEIPGRLHLRGRQVLDNYMQFVEPGYGNQNFPGRNANVTNVTRLQAVQTAIDQQLTDLVQAYPNRRPAIIAFNNEVAYLGDGSCEPVRIGEHNLWNREMLVKAGESAPLPGRVRDNRQSLMAKLFELEECGRTALGPALVMAVAVAGRIRGSKVVLCTDGLANVGLGNMDVESSGPGSEELGLPTADFYEDVGKVASEKGVSVSIVTIRGTTCNLAKLSAIARQTSGEVTTVDPLHLEREFANVMRHDILATNATATFLVHKSLYIEGEDVNSVMRRVHHGNVKKNSEITFKFGVKRVYRRCFHEQLRATAEAANGTAAAATADSTQHSARNPPAVTDPHSKADGNETKLLGAYTEPRRSHVVCQETGATTQAVTPTLEGCTTALNASEGPEAHAHLPYHKQAQFATPFTVAHTKPVTSSAAADPSSSGVSGAAKRLLATTAAHRYDYATHPAGDLSSTAGCTSECRSSWGTTKIPDEVCFQIKVEYTDRAGGRALRVLTVKRPLTTDRLLTERTIRPSVVCVHARQQAGSALMGQNSGFGMRLLESTERLLSRSSAPVSVLNQFKKTVSATKEQCTASSMTDESAANFYRHIVADSSEYVDPNPTDKLTEDSDGTA